MNENIKRLPNKTICVGLTFLGRAWSGYLADHIQPKLSETENLEQMVQVAREALKKYGEYSKKLGFMMLYKMVESVEIDGKIFSNTSTIETITDGELDNFDFFKVQENLWNNL